MKMKNAVVIPAMVIPSKQLQISWSALRHVAVSLESRPIFRPWVLADLVSRTGLRLVHAVSPPSTDRTAPVT